MPQLRLKLPPKQESFWDALRSLTWVQWSLFLSSWLAWACDGIDFYSVPLSVKALGSQFHRSTTAISASITLTLLFRPLGALIFGLLSDRYGRKWPLVANLLICFAAELGASFTSNFHQFLAARCIFGMAMGGTWGLAASNALENLPVPLRGIASPVYQHAYSVGYITAAVINLKLVPENPHGWRALFWVAAGISFVAALFRTMLPESDYFLKARAAAGKNGSTARMTSVYIRQCRVMLSQHWKLWIYTILLMAGFHFLAHAAQDLYPTFLETTKHISDHDANVAVIIGNCGAIMGGIFSGVSQYIGRKATMMILVAWVGAFIPLWILPNSYGALVTGAFFLEFGVQGSFSVLPIYLSELSPPAFRALFIGFTSQVGNMISAASAQIEATAGEHRRIIVNGKSTPDYGMVQGIFEGIIVCYTLFLLLVGSENHSARFENHKAAFEEGSGRGDAYRGDDEIKENEDQSEDGSAEKSMP